MWKVRYPKRTFSLYKGEVVKVTCKMIYILQEDFDEGTWKKKQILRTVDT